MNTPATPSATLWKILAVDDEPDLELLITQRFRREIRAGEVAFQFARDGRQALEQFAANAEIGIVDETVSGILGRLRPAAGRQLRGRTAVVTVRALAGP